MPSSQRFNPTSVPGSFSSMVIPPDTPPAEGLKVPQPQILGPKLHLRLDALPNSWEE
jgi:hypothetical protein